MSLCSLQSLGKGISSGMVRDSGESPRIIRDAGPVRPPIKWTPPYFESCLKNSTSSAPCAGDQGRSLNPRPQSRTTGLP